MLQQKSIRAQLYNHSCEVIHFQVPSSNLNINLTYHKCSQTEGTIRCSGIQCGLQVPNFDFSKIIQLAYII